MRVPCATARTSYLPSAALFTQEFLSLITLDGNSLCISASEATHTHTPPPPPPLELFQLLLGAALSLLFAFHNQ